MKQNWLLLLAAVLITGCNSGHSFKPTDKDESIDSIESSSYNPYDEFALDFFGIKLQGESIESIAKLMNDSCDVLKVTNWNSDLEGAYTVTFCGIPFGMNLKTHKKDGKVYVNSIAFSTSKRMGLIYKHLIKSISAYYGEPDEITIKPEDPDGGTVVWEGVRMRNLHTNEGGTCIFFNLY